MTTAKVPPVAVVTGGAVRVGRAIAMALASDGYDLLVTYRSSKAPARALQEAVSAMGRRCEILGTDLSTAEGAEAVIPAAAAHFGRLDLLVNSAASFDSTPLLEVDADRWDGNFDLNVRAPHLLVRAAAPLLREAQGSVVNIVDLSAFQPWTEYPAHSVSKAALTHLTRVQARSLAPDIRVNGIAPGAVLPPDDWTPERTARLADIAPLKRIGSPDDVAQAVLYFAKAGFVTGQILAVDGGRLLGPSGPPSE